MHIINRNDDISRKIIDIILKFGPISKCQSPDYGIASSSFFYHAKILVQQGILVRFKENRIGTGQRKILYKVVKSNY